MYTTDRSEPSEGVRALAAFHFAAYAISPSPFCSEEVTVLRRYAELTDCTHIGHDDALQNYCVHYYAAQFLSFFCISHSITYVLKV